MSSRVQIVHTLLGYVPGNGKRHGKVDVAMDILADPERLRRLDLTLLD
jgi:hypothetical protein